MSEQENYELHRHGRRRSDDSQDGMPWWVKAVSFFGVPSAIAIGLVYSLVNYMVPTMLETQKTLNTVVITLGAISTEHSYTKEQNERIIGVLRATCANAAKGDYERTQCMR